ncbi:PREDICTED: uncharacterized protein LOC109244901 [Nicotiana attenuata]|uniref:uncharacterized protein LOC109244901 n=1 Tax=Nicotiana attenuata TaxID=49451 RepID=UPI000905D590|nr:PREDICTED: uncharacterized protein LOC109244901 [Nicotiana attenuata]
MSPRCMVVRRIGPHPVLVAVLGRPDERECVITCINGGVSVTCRGSGLLIDDQCGIRLVLVSHSSSNFSLLVVLLRLWMWKLLSHAKQLHFHVGEVGLNPEVKKQFWDDLDEMVRSIPHTEKLFIGGDFSGHIGASAGGYDDVHGGYDFRDSNEGGNSLLEFARAFDLVIDNSSFLKREEHLVTFRNLMGNTQIDYLLCRKCDKGLCTDCKVIPSEHLTTLHRLLVMDLEIKRSRRKRAGVVAGEVLRVTKGSPGGHKGDWWWNGEVQGKVEAKKAAYLKLVESTNE